MQDLNDKITGDTLTATEWNEVPSEIQNVIEESAIVLSSGDVAQMLQSIYNIARRGLLFVDSGNTNSYILSSSQSQAATEYRDGMLVIFNVGNENTGASTVNVDGLGNQNIYGTYGTTTAISSGDIVGLITLIYDGTNFAIYQGGGSSGGAGSTFYANNTTLFWRNFANTLNIGVLSFDTQDRAIVGDSSYKTIVNGSSVELTFGGTSTIKTTNPTATSTTITTGGSVIDNSNTSHDIGYNLMPPVQASTNQTLDSKNCGKLILATSPSLTFTVGNNSNIVQGATWMIGNRASSGTLTINSNGNTMYLMDGSGAETTGNRAIAVSGVCTVVKQTSNTYLIYGNGIS